MATVFRTTTEAKGRAPSRPLGESIIRVLTTTDHKVIGKLYLTTSFAWFLSAGVMALIIRSELANPGMQFVNEEVYNQLFTMHGTIMLLLFATPLFFGFGNVLMPLQIGSPDVAFPRLNMFSYWLFLFGGLIAASGFLTPQGAADFGWTAYTPLSDAGRSPRGGLGRRTLSVGLLRRGNQPWVSLSKARNDADSVCRQSQLRGGRARCCLSTGGEPGTFGPLRLERPEEEGERDTRTPTLARGCLDLTAPTHTRAVG